MHIPPPGLEQPQEVSLGQEALAGDAVPADAEQEEEESDIVADFAPEGAASGAPEEFPLTTNDSEGDEAAVEEAAADVDVDVEPTAVQEEGDPLAYHPISSVLARPTILKPAVTGYPTLGLTVPAFGSS